MDALPLIAKAVAEMAVVPSAFAPAMPLLLMLTISPEPLDQETELVKSLVLLSVYAPVAVICCVVPSGIVTLPDVTAIEVSCAAETVNVLAPVMPAEVALSDAVPIFRPVTTPEEFTFNKPCGELPHATELVTSCVLPSE